MRIQFDEEGVFEALWAAEDWCNVNGYSYGPGCAKMPTGLMRGNHTIPKWRNLRQDQINLLDGVMTGDRRNGPVFIEIKDEGEKK